MSLNNHVLLLLVTISISISLGLSNQVLAKGDVKKSDHIRIKVDIHHKSYYDSRLSEPGVLSSRVRVTLGQESFRVGDYLHQFAIPNRNVRSVDHFLIDISVGLSIAPTLLKNRTLESLEEKVDATLKKKEPLITAQVTREIDRYLSTNPQIKPGIHYNNLPAGQRAALRAQFIGVTTAQTIADLRAAANKKHKDRVDHLQLETSVQEVVVTFAWQLNNSALLFFKLGKYNQNVATGMNRNHQTELDQARLRRNNTQRMTGAGPTTGATAGLIKRYDGYTVQAELALFHDRIPFMDAEDYISRIVTLTDSEYEKHKDLDDIDSGRIRVNIRSKKVDMYVTAGSYDGKNAYATGMVIRITPKLKVHGDYAQSDRDYTAEKGVSVFMSYDTNIFDRQTTFYIGQERLSSSPIIYSAGKEDIGETSMGAKVVIWSGKYRNVGGEMTLHAEYFNIDHTPLSGGGPGYDEDGFRSGFQFRGYFD